MGILDTAYLNFMILKSTSLIVNTNDRSQTKPSKLLSYSQ